MYILTTENYDDINENKYTSHKLYLAPTGIGFELILIDETAQIKPLVILTQGWMRDQHF
jgi:hypothetical protein